MNKKQATIKNYIKPEIKVVKMQTEFFLLNGSKIGGGHNKGSLVGGGGDAKQGMFEEEDDEFNSDDISSDAENNIFNNMY